MNSDKKDCIYILVGLFMFWVLVISCLHTKAQHFEDEQKRAQKVISQTTIPDKPQVLCADSSVPETKQRLKLLGNFKVTAYCPCKKCCGAWAENRPKDENGKEIVYTASGATAKEGQTISVDPKVIPLGSKVVINGKEYIAQDTGGTIKGNVIDIYFKNHQDAVNFGVQHLDVYIVEK